MRKLLLKMMGLLLIISIISCNEEGAYGYMGVVVSLNDKMPLDSVFCRLFIDDKLFDEQLTDSTGQFNISWSGYINKHTGQAEFSKDGFEKHIIYSDQQPVLIGDTVFLEPKIN
ncbi:MAG TPA: hypothetical protein DCQ26_00335 [Marinilabiliales bacterium]|nr:MAG: hypothetical protein A2W95_03830 [Bacteroidetes bacterium GWA2_40_14]OFX75225.1 MAG: hypothetical protein A2W96_16640 [Bacteroidetes bacterium GWD2_40_43]OFX89822.1 MAG: hypothetical protein A2W97_12300 [Bacteroidetes bacterium GWE2_40_63]OFY21985.1 MAG: hypothetical protein A2W88_00545 [Bacteroidetes bacterium GWF2_40_13]OFZ30331.1 MAG: hypothetical protein A2437_09995 [Bacteroidetes bacterium RIFOXYC2_FULL_40_12]HAM97035.1 hypothetical protein [Marinilabiliales bacterium]